MIEIIVITIISVILAAIVMAIMILIPDDIIVEFRIVIPICDILCKIALVVIAVVSAYMIGVRL